MTPIPGIIVHEAAHRLFRRLRGIPVTFFLLWAGAPKGMHAFPSLKLFGA